MPIVSEDGETDVIEICPPPYLHIVVLRPFNLIWNTMKKYVCLQSFESANHMKSDGKGGDFSGTTIRKIIHNDNKLAEHHL